MYKDLKLENVNNDQYNSYRNRLNALIRLTKRNYYLNVFSNFRNHTKKLWQTINSITKTSASHTKLNAIIRDGKLLTKGKDISNAFNDFFCKCGKKLR